jgi:hypothetical protein
MWLKTVTNGYFNMLTGTDVEVKESRHGDEFRVVVNQVNSPNPLVTLQGGFASLDDAQDALDNAMDDQDVISIDAPEPVSDESDVEGEESTEDETMDYGNMSNAQLRTELASRNLSTEGNKAELISRLTEADMAQEQE